jgi:Rieske Fe-S protein
MSKDFPISSEEDGFVARREFTKFLGLTSMALFVGNLVVAGRRFWRQYTAADGNALRVSAVGELPVGGYKLFRYPGENDPCILLRLAEDKFVAYDQRCTHLSCPVVFNSESRHMECPCHKGFFSAEDGSVLAGPPKRPLESFKVSVRDTYLWVSNESKS